MDDETTGGLRIIAAGLSRFFDEGHTRWQRDQLEALLEPPLHIDAPAFQRQLHIWEAEGAVRLDQYDVYLTVMRPVELETGDP